MKKKKEQTKPKAIQKRIIRIRAEINKIENWKTIEKITETKKYIYFFIKTNKIDKSLTRLTTEKKERLKSLISEMKRHCDCLKSAQNAVTKYHKLGDLAVTETYFSQ